LRSAPSSAPLLGCGSPLSCREELTLVMSFVLWEFDMSYGQYSWLITIKNGAIITIQWFIGIYNIDHGSHDFNHPSMNSNWGLKKHQTYGDLIDK